jgi:alcohol dehydrogenase class IV
MALSNEVTVRRLRKDQNNSPALRKYLVLGEIFCGSKGKSEDYIIDGFIDYLHKLTDDLHLPGLGEEGVKEDDLKEISMNTECKNNPVKLDVDDLMEILTRRFC